MMRRGTARPGDALFVSGTLAMRHWGWCQARPFECRRLGPDPGRGRAFAQALFAAPAAVALGAPLREHASAAMDISDGLAKDLARMCAASGCAGRVRLAAVPLSEGTAKALAADPGLVSRIVGGGDDYEVLAGVPASQAASFEADAAAASVAVSRVGSIVAGSGIVIEGADGQPVALDRPGWDHFLGESVGQQLYPPGPPKTST